MVVTDVYLLEIKSKILFRYIYKFSEKSDTVFFSFLLDVLGWHWLPQLQRFQVHDSTSHHLHIVLCVHHPSQVSAHHHSPPCTLLHLLPGRHHTVVCVCEGFLSLFSFSLFFAQSPHPPPNNPESWQPALYLGDCLYFDMFKIWHSRCLIKHR